MVNLPNHTVVFNLSLGDVVPGDLIGLPMEQQRRQMSKPFERFGMHWILVIEKQNRPTNNRRVRFDVIVYLYCLSVPVNKRTFPLKGEITIDQLAQDAQVRTFNGTTGRCCNLVGKQFSADAVKIKGIILSLHSGETRSEEIIIDMYKDEFGGYYDELWRGIGGVLLENHNFDPCRDGAAIEVNLRFLGTPRALRFVDHDN